MVKLVKECKLIYSCEREEGNKRDFDTLYLTKVEGGYAVSFDRGMTKKVIPTFAEAKAFALRYCSAEDYRNSVMDI